METNSNISSKPSEWGTVPKTHLELPLWRAIEMLWVKKKVDFLSPVITCAYLVWNSFHACLPCFYLSLIAQTCPNLPKIAFTLFFHCLNKKMWLQKVLALLSLALVISLIQCTGVCWEVALEPIELPFILSGVCSPSEANYCSNPFEIFFSTKS